MGTALLSPVTTVLAHGPWDGHGHGPGHGFGFGPGPGLWWLIFPFVWLLIVATVIVVLGRFGRRRWRHEPVRSAESRLAERYASGDIDESEYEQRLATLRRLDP